MAPSEPSMGSLNTSSAPSDRVTAFRPWETFEGITRVHFRPSAAVSQL